MVRYVTLSLSGVAERLQHTYVPAALYERVQAPEIGACASARLV